jgi:hypothetical protein
MLGRAVWLSSVLTLVGWGAGAAEPADKAGAAPADGDAPDAAPAAKATDKAKPAPPVDDPGSMGKPKHSGPGWFTWVGFEKGEAGPRVLVRLSSPLDAAGVGQARAGDEVVLTFPGYKLDTKNDGRPLDTRYFKTDVVRVQAKPAKAGIEVHVRFRREANDAHLSTAAAPDGETLIYADF